MLHAIESSVDEDGIMYGAYILQVAGCRLRVQIRLKIIAKL